MIPSTNSEIYPALGVEGVSRAEKEAILIRVIELIGFKQHRTSFAIENYCDRHEIDTSFVPSDGDLLSFEASDNFPKDNGLIDLQCKENKLLLVKVCRAGLSRLILTHQGLQAS
jgi:hypothetical protein